MADGVKTTESDLAEVWGDVISKRHLLRSVVLGITLSLSSYVAGYHALIRFASPSDEALTRGYALFLGVGGCLAAAIIACLLYQPKRVLSEMYSADEQIFEALKEEGISIEEELAGLRALPADVRRELEDVQVYDRLIRLLETARATEAERGEASWS